MKEISLKNNRISTADMVSNSIGSTLNSLDIQDGLVHHALYRFLIAGAQAEQTLQTMIRSHGCELRLRWLKMHKLLTPHRQACINSYNIVIQSEDIIKACQIESVVRIGKISII